MYKSKNKIKAKKSDDLLPPGWTCQECGVMGASIHIKIKIEAVNVSEAQEGDDLPCKQALMQKSKI